MTLKYAELCAGYGGLGLAVEEVFSAELAWYSEFDKAPSQIMAYHWPDAPNHGDMTKIDWSAVKAVDILSGGTPCQDLSHAGHRAGMTEGTRSNLWVQMREAIATIKPTYVVWENVRGAYSAGADSDLEPCPGCVGDPRDGRTLLRALGRVLGDLSDLGYDCQWRGLRAADVGAPHGRFRVFLLATRRGTTPDPGGSRGNQAVQHHGSGAPAIHRAGLPDQSDRHTLRSGPKRGHDGKTRDARGRFARLTADTGRRELQRLGGNQRVGSAPSSSEGIFGEWQRVRDAPGHSRPHDHGVDWGPYAPAIRRWEAVRGTAPAPTELTDKGKHRLSARFAEWMMGVDPGWITDVPGISRNDMLKAAGNGVVPQQAAAALRHMLTTHQRQENAA
ncbi:DNA cytosine methyltransferase [Arthrobacter sp. USHLN218]|uniref:DNA cytosine methyltransferase n=1 Tax=Arthrobacter sp. USHLN218 TaxID=3081232 RepID=UPI003FA57767